MTSIQWTIDDLIDASLMRYREWRLDADAVSEAAQVWSYAASRERVVRYAGYVAALDQEQSAADAYARSLEDLDRYAGRLPAADLRQRSEAAEIVTNLVARSSANANTRRQSR